VVTEATSLCRPQSLLEQIAQTKIRRARRTEALAEVNRGRVRVDDGVELDGRAYPLL
jgi:hypothetical protein